MIISPPYLPVPAANTDDETYVANAMPDSRDVAPDSGGAPLGSYPLTTALTWHNGLHIAAPAAPDAGQHLPVRAVADGTVIFKSEPVPKNSDAAHPQNYNVQGDTAAWTDNGIVIIRHQTDIGAAVTTPTSITYYSVYMHLSSIEATVAQNQPIWRKDLIGAAGSVQGSEAQIHFEICMNAAELQKLVGAQRPITWTDPATAPTADGRTDAVFGSTYVYLPAGTPTSATTPTIHMRPRAGAAAANATSLAQAQWVEIRYRNGACITTSYHASATAGGPQVGDPIGQPLTEATYEYDLYDEATRRHGSLNATTQATSSPSAWYELLRFGRKLGTDPLPADVAHWRKITTDTGTVWADLNATGTCKFSDADFPAFKGWQCFDDDTSHDNQRCDSERIKTLVRDPLAQAGPREGQALRRRLGVTQVRDRLRLAICKFPTEWDKSTIVQRYEWLKTDEEFKVDEGKPWDDFKAHSEAISFDGLPQEYKDATWHIHPRTFIQHMRRCGWLSAREMAQCFPRRLQHLTGTTFHTTVFAWRDALAQANTWMLPFNKANRKYDIDARQRLVHYFSHVIPETGYLRLVKESDNRSGTYLRSKPYYPYYGRGLIQLTWADNYEKYGKFRKFPITERAPAQYSAVGWNPDTLIALNNTTFNADNCADSAGYYIASHNSMLEKMDNGIATSDAVAVSRCVNGNVAIQNLNGLDARLQSVVFLKYVLLDHVAPGATERLRFEWRRNSQKEATGRLNSKGQPIKAFILKVPPWEIDVFLDRQIP